MTRLVLALAVLFSSAVGQPSPDTKPQPESKPPELPKHARINGGTWELRIVDRLPGPRVATTNCDHHIIKLVSTIPSPRELADAIWHEIMHALVDCNDTAWNNTGNEDDPDDGHTGIYTMTPRILDLLVDNPELIRYLQYQAGRK